MRLAYIYNPKASFENQDKHILQDYFDVVPIDKPRTKLEWLSYYSDLGEIKHCDAVFSWFAGWPSYLAMLTARARKKPIAVVTGGYDVARVPEIGYGATLNLKERRITNSVLRNADLLIPVSHANENDMLDRCSPKQYQMIYNAVDDNIFKPDGTTERKNRVLTVGAITLGNYEKKGLRAFVQAAKDVPEHRFVMVGGGDSDLVHQIRENKPDNLILTGYLDEPSLISQYQMASVYLQPSSHESFGVSVVEAMLCGCIPVVSDRYALPEITRFPEWVYPYGNPDELAERIRAAVDAGEQWRDMARARGRFFSIEKREHDLVDALARMMG